MLNGRPSDPKLISFAAHCFELEEYTSFEVNCPNMRTYVQTTRGYPNIHKFYTRADAEAFARKWGGEVQEVRRVNHKRVSWT